MISYLINFVCGTDDIILDSFAGSGTTAHAVLNLNKKDKGNRKFILVEMEDYAENITAERVRRVMQGYGEGKNAVAGTGGAFDYYELGERMFDEEQNLNENIGEEKIREYIYYTETKRHLERERSDASKYLLDTYNATGYYFYYERDRLTTLCIDTLHIVTERAEQYVIYADTCTVPPQVLAAQNITLKKIRATSNDSDYMELKQYQKEVISDLDAYIGYVEKCNRPDTAFHKFWEDKGIPISAIDNYYLHPYDNSITDVLHVTVKVPTAGGKTFIACNALNTIFKHLPPKSRKSWHGSFRRIRF